MINPIRIVFILSLSLYTNIYCFAQVREITFEKTQVHDLNKFTSFQPSAANVIDTPLSDNKFMNSKAVKILDVPVILTSISLATIPFKYKLQNIRDTYTPNFYRSFDDYSQYLPAAVMLGLKASGVESRSSWGRMLTADAFSLLTMTALVNSIKYTAKVQRPGNGTYNSYPSGHAATAFMTATMLHKEYGQRSKWYSIGAYGTATITSVTRVLDNRHWMSDIFFGAAIGILSAELGYLFSDLIFKNKGLNNKYKVDFVSYDKELHPSFISLYTSINLFTGSFNNNGAEVKLKNSGRFGVEGAWYMNKYIGLGGQATISTVDVQTAGNQMGMISGLVGGYFSYPLSDRWRVGSKLLVGADFVKQPISKIVKIADYATTASTGINISYLTDRNFGFKVFTDYRRHFKLINNRGSNELNFGVSVDFIFGE